jgi:hypothetical protein
MIDSPRGLGSGNRLTEQAPFAPPPLIIPHHQRFGVGCTDPDAKSLLSLPSSRRVTRTRPAIRSAHAVEGMYMYIRQRTDRCCLHVSAHEIASYLLCSEFLAGASVYACVHRGGQGRSSDRPTTILLHVDLLTDYRAKSAT